MGWAIEFDEKIQKTLKKLDKPTAKKILDYLKNDVLNRGDPKTLGKELRGNLSGFWRYRVQDYRIICKLKDEKMIVLVVKIGHRKNIYN